MIDPTDDRLNRYETPKAPAGFADRVLTRIAQASTPPVAPARPSRKKWALLGSAGVAAAAGLAVVVFVGRTEMDMNKAMAPSDNVAYERVDTQDRRTDGLKNSHTIDGVLTPHGQFAGKGKEKANWATATGLSRADLGHNTEAYAKLDDNRYHAVAKDPLSTFSIDVDTASYANLRRFVDMGRLPPKDAIRIEEMINYFRYSYPAPESNEPFSITTDVATSPWNPKYQLVRIGLATAPIADSQVPARNLVFLLDVSGSMNTPKRLPLVKQAMQLLVDNLRPQDTVSIVTYAGHSGLALPATKGTDKDTIRAAIQQLSPGGSTNGASGIQLAYNVAAANAVKGGINRVILCTDGDFNVGVTSPSDLIRLIEKERERGVFLTVLGFGMNNYKDATLEQLANRGNGNHAYIDSLAEARKVLVKEAGATLVTVAKDVKLQVEFNPTKVAGYRLVGYENRVLAARDFNDDKKDAGDIGAGHAVTALYEIIPAGLSVPDASVDDLKYQTKPSPAVTSNELMTVKIRYKEPTASQSKLLSRVVDGDANDLANAAVDFRWATAMASFGMMLRESPYRGNLSWAQIKSLAEGALGQDAEGYRKNALTLIDRASKLQPTTP